MRQRNQNKSKQLLLYSSMVLLSSVSFTKVESAHAFWERPNLCTIFDRTFPTMPAWRKDLIARSMLRACVVENEKIAYYFSQYLNKKSRAELFFKMDDFQIRTRQVFNGVDYKSLSSNDAILDYEKKVISSEIEKNKKFIQRHISFFEDLKLPDRCLSLENTDGCADVIARKTGAPTSGILKARVAKWNGLSETNGD